MSTWLSKRLSVDLATIDSGRDKRRETDDDEDHFLIWMHLVPSTELPNGKRLRAVVQSLEGVGFELSQEDRRYKVYPADIADDEYSFSSVGGMCERLATVGGGVFFQGRGAGIALLCDPHARSRAETIRRSSVDDVVGFGEFSIWLPRPDLNGVTHDHAAASILEALPHIEAMVNFDFSFAISTDELRELATRWPFHRQVSSRQLPSELMWYQSLSNDFAAVVPPDKYQAEGLLVEARAWGGFSASLSPLPSVGLSMLRSARRRWPYSNIPDVVC